MEPCVFIHYSNCNIRNCTLLEALKSPIFMAYHRQQPFNENMLQPCPMLENPEKLRAIVKETGAVSTDYESPEDVDTPVSYTHLDVYKRQNPIKPPQIQEITSRNTNSISLPMAKEIYSQSIFSPRFKSPALYCIDYISFS